MKKTVKNMEKSEIKQLKETISKLKAQVRNFKKKIDYLEHERDTVYKAWQETEDYLIKTTKHKSLEEVLEQAGKNKKSKTKRSKKQEKLDEQEDPRAYWAKWRKENL